MADKPIMKYEVRPQLDRINNVTIYVPSIVDGTDYASNAKTATLVSAE